MTACSASIASSTRRAASAGLLADQLGNIVERERLRVDGLDHAVVKIPADPVALVHDRQPAHLVVQSGVLDGDPGVQREHLDQCLVLLAELGRPQLVGQVQAPDRRARRW